jgi:DNA repair protein RadC
MTIAADNATIDAALTILARRLEQKRSGHVIDSPRTVRDFLTLRYADRPVEIFGAILVDSQQRVIEVREVSIGTVDQASVYPREVARAAIETGAVAAILFHNHPSQCAEPSGADRLLTETLKGSLSTVGVRCLDHLIVAGMATYSFAEHGLI